MAAGAEKRIRHLAAGDVESVRCLPSEVRPIDADALAGKATVERLVRRDGVVTACGERQTDANGLVDVGSQPEPVPDTLTIALRAALLVV